MFLGNFILKRNIGILNKKKLLNFLRSLWALRDSNPRPSGCKPDALNQLS